MKQVNGNQYLIDKELLFSNVEKEQETLIEDLRNQNDKANLNIFVT